MKHFLLLFLAAGIINTAATAEGLVKLHGRIHNPVADSIYISFNNGRLAYDPVQLGIMLNKDGTFSTSFTVTEKFTPVSMRYAGRKAELVVEPGYDLELGAEGKNFDSSLHYKGIGSEVGNFVALHIIEKGLMENYITKLLPRFIDSPMVFKKVMTNAEQDEVLFLNKHMSDLPFSFVQYWVSYYHFFSYFGLMQYPLFHEMVRLKSNAVQSIPPANYTAIADIPDLFNDSLLDISAYRMFVDQLYRIKLSAAGYENKPADSAKRYRQDDSVISLYYSRMPPATGEYAVASMIYGNARHQPLERSDRQFENFKEHWPNSTYITPIQRQIAIARRLAKGEKAMDFTITTPQHATLKLSSLKGKVVLLTFWSSAYEQGMLDLRLTSKLFTYFKDSNVAFVYVNIDENDQVWKAAIEKNKLSGIHTRVNGWKSMLAELYGIQSVPTFFLIDKHGNFASANTPLPRMGDALGNEIQRLLRE